MCSKLTKKNTHKKNELKAVSRYDGITNKDTLTIQISIQFEIKKNKQKHTCIENRRHTGSFDRSSYVNPTKLFSSSAAFVQTTCTGLAIELFCNNENNKIANNALAFDK